MAVPQDISDPVLTTLAKVCVASIANSTSCPRFPPIRAAPRAHIASQKLRGEA